MTDVEVLRYAAFTDDPSGGNPAGVVLDATGLSDGEQLAIAAEVGYSETAFLVAAGAPRRYAVRYFSPLAEVPFCGHATIASAVALGERNGVGPIDFDTQVGLVRIETAVDAQGRMLATFISVPTSTRPASDDEVRSTLAALHWAPDDLDPRFPAHVANGGNDHLVLAARTRARLADLRYDFPALSEIMAKRGWTTVHLFWAENATVFHARDPFPPGGVVEDPATGAAAAAFTGYLRELEHIGDGAVITISQGVDMGRPSTLTCESVGARVRVSGAAAEIVQH